MLPRMCRGHCVYTSKTKHLPCRSFHLNRSHYSTTMPFVFPSKTESLEYIKERTHNYSLEIKNIPWRILKMNQSQERRILIVQRGKSSITGQKNRIKRQAHFKGSRFIVVVGHDPKSYTQKERIGQDCKNSCIP